MIALRGVTKRFRDGDVEQVVLDGIDLDVAPGEMVAVVGASGSGKSTLLYIVGGLDGDFGGEAVVAERSLRALSARERAAFRSTAVAFVFQAFNLVPGLSALENVMLPGYFRPGVGPGSSPRLEEMRAGALEALARVGLEDKASKRPALLSGGERQRVAIARALFARPKVLLADEPTGNLDVVSGAGIITTFEELTRAGMTVLVVTHEDRVSRAAHRVLRLEKGRLW